MLASPVSKLALVTIFAAALPFAGCTSAPDPATSTETAAAAEPAARRQLDAAPQASSFCGAKSPAFPVPETRGGIRLWPSGLRPGKPGQQIPSDRDSTQYTSNTFPCAASGHELFWAIDVVGDRVFVMYNVGFSIWDVAGARAENPRKIDQRDGVAGHWLYHEGAGEADGFLTDIAAIADPANPNRILIAISSLAPVGASIWRFDRDTNVLTQAYQNTALESNDVQLIVSGGVAYAFFAAGTGAFVLDASATSALPAGCLDAACPPAIYRGKVGSAAGSRYVSAIERGGKVYLASAVGGLAPSSPRPEIWEVSPAAPVGAVRRYQGTVRDTHSPVLFAKGGKSYMAVVESKRVKIYEVDDCLDASGCTALPAAVFDHPLRSQNWAYHFLSYLVSEGSPFLYYGFEGIFPKGAAYERLFDLSNLGSASPPVEITAGGGSYADSCTPANTEIGYWSDYYENNGNGYRNYAPRKGKFNGKYFYKVNTATFDVHVRENIVVNPTITTLPAAPAPYFFGDSLAFTATAQVCPGAETWTWHASKPASGLASATSAATLGFSLCGAQRCPDENVEVWGLKTACAAHPGLVQQRAQVKLQDPRPQVAAIEVLPASPTPNSYPVCSQLAFSATATGKPPLAYQWQVRNGAGQQIAGGNSSTFVWNTAGVNLGAELFADGFESGNTGHWNPPAAFGGARPLLDDAAAVITEVAGAGSATFAVALRVNNATGSPGALTRNITLNALGPLAFGPTPITVTSLGAGQYRFRANTSNATRWRWEFEDSGAGGTVGCQSFPRCRVVDYGMDDAEITYTWAPPNLDGPQRVRVQAANCMASVPAIGSQVTVNVSGIPAGAPPEVTSFAILPGPHCSLNLSVLECRRGQPIQFTVSHSGSATQYSFDWDGDGSFEQSLPVGSAISHTYGAVGVRSPKARARNGSSAPGPDHGLPWLLAIVE